MGGTSSAHDAGFALRTHEELARSADVTVTPWGRIEGMLRIGNRPARKQKVSAWMINQGFHGRVDYDTVTDETGRFVLERVTPGLMSVNRYVDTPDNRGWTPSNPVFVEVGPGRTVHVEVGGTGRPVIGRLRIPRGLSLAQFVLGHGDLSVVRPEPRKPDDFPDYTDERKLAWYDRFNGSAEGRAYRLEERKYAVDLRADGTFRIEDVPAGRYVLKLPFRSRTDQESERLLAAARAEVTVPGIPGGRSDEPLDLGEVRLEVFRFHELKVGDPAPALTRNAADGRPIDLGSLRGKFVLLNFWATHNPSSLADLAFLKEVHDTFGRDPRLAMIGLSLDVDPDPPMRYARWKGLAWEQRYLGVTDLPTPAAAFGVMYPPQVMLIGPDGRVVARDLGGDAIKPAVAQALGPKP